MMLVDMVKLRQRFDDDEALLAEIFAVFKCESPGRRRHIEAALAGADCDRMAGLAHSLKGVAATMFAEPLRQAAYTLEMAARAGDIAAVAAAVPAVLDLLAATAGDLPG
jgi:HPt (histidine-containing phosphotransfer) domain-containing protein